ncbi:hypothetical protein GYMLUDRAFT_242839 [Collybiopsis luxurians FD-317 M1]|uniref:F-box domain-containing protein n=1 Tax=Collybiopsis luxurians FD-317 M1 TaxID=944289 RepID=A0A0D0CZU0_9AGAR|nr:hypothetical protein GYMLUDRAFT_242839 [Collybiopsis luxurians FD-317 M1]
MGFFRFLDLYPPNSEIQVSFDLTVPQSSLHSLSITPKSCSYSPIIPPEIILTIMDAAYDESEPNNKAVFRNFALVCKAWSLPAQKLLFRHLILNSESDYLAFHSAVSRTRLLGDAVRSIRASLDPNQPCGLAQRDFATVVTLCPNLDRLDLSLYGSVSSGESAFDDSVIELLKSGPQISSLRFTNWSDNRHALTQLLGVWTTLKSLVIGGTPPELLLPSSRSPSPSPPSLEPFPCSLEKLGLNFQSSPSIDFFRWLLHHSSETLHTLEFEREPSSSSSPSTAASASTSQAVLHHLLHAHHTTLTTLALPSCSRATARVLEKCTNLKRFSVEDGRDLGVALSRLGGGGTLEYLGFGMDKEVGLQGVLDAVKASRDDLGCDSTSSLKEVTVNLWDGAKLHRQLPSLKMACALRGVRLEITDNVKVFRGVMRDEH